MAAKSWRPAACQKSPLCSDASDGSLSDEENAEGNGISENASGEEQSESGEEGNTSDREGSTRPDDLVDTISVVDHGLDVSASDDPDVENEVRSRLPRKRITNSCTLVR